MHSVSVQSGDGATITWTDPKRRAWLLGLIVPLMPFAAAGLVELTGLGIFWWAGPMLVFLAMPTIDTVLGRDADNPPEEVVPALDADRYYRWCTFLYIPLQYASLVFACALWATGDLSVIDSLGLAITVGSVAGIAIAGDQKQGKRDSGSQHASSWGPICSPVKTPRRGDAEELISWR